MLLGLCSSHWSVVWFILELNTISICYLILLDIRKVKINDSSVFFYYLVQVFSSFILVCRVFLFSIFYFSLVLMLMVFLKMGGWPLHLWYIKIFDKLDMSYNSIIFLSTLQKVLPIFILSFFLFSPLLFYLFSFFCFWTIFISIIYLFYGDCLSFKSIIALSSLNSNGWMFLSLVSSLAVYFIFFFLYSFSLLVVLLYSFSSLLKNSFIVGIISFISILLFSSLGGLPPFTIFWGKLLVVKFLLLSYFPFELIFFIIIGSCLVLYYYMYIFLIDCMTGFVKNNISISLGLDYYLNFVFTVSLFSFLGIFSYLLYS